MYLDEQRKQAASPLASYRPARKINRRKVEKSVTRLAVPTEHIAVERGVPNNDTEYNHLFQALLRDPSPISPERAKDYKRQRSASRNGAMSARLDRSGRTSYQ